MFVLRKTLLSSHRLAAITRLPAMRSFSTMVEVIDDKKTGQAALCSTEYAEKGTVMIRERAAKVFKEPTKYTIQRDESKHLLFTGPIKYTNHSFKPNVTVEFDHEDELVVSMVACREIHPGEEICFDYNTTESSMAEPFVDFVTGEKVQGSTKVE
mmetsp:Transcript_46700/g.77582  ORF Transcript_46700/g.77582 Transcript_46700/m.77582 type:complete len:155 (-) Transcript_46700:652-1116(-)|eukprot:jgi/Bigna1/136495/aug1.34_g11203